MPKPRIALVGLPIIAAHQLEQRQRPFDGPEWLFEMKYDGYRGLLYVERGTGRLVSRNDRVMRRCATFAQSLAQMLRVETAILNGEIITKDAAGRPIFLDLMRRRDEASYVAFDLLWLNGLDPRGLPLLERLAVTHAFGAEELIGGPGVRYLGSELRALRGHRPQLLGRTCGFFSNSRSNL